MPKTTLHISIPEPCHEDWSKMTATQCGAFCQACQKEVIDFSTKSEAEIVEILSKASGKVCGRIPADKLNRELIKYEPDHAWYSWKKWAVAAGVLLGIGEANAANTLNADTIAKPRTDSIAVLPTVVVTESYKRDYNNAIVGALYSVPLDTPKTQPLSHDSVIKISGKITDLFDDPLQDAIVIINNQKGEGTLTDINGQYVLTVPAHLHNKSFSFSVKYLGYSDTTFSVIADRDIIRDVRLRPTTQTITELHAVGLMIRTTPAMRIRNFFRRIGYAFKKHKD